MKQTQTEALFDIYVIGGGINGVGIAVDAAGRGLKVGLCEKSDLAGATSSASSKLIHGGLRYLEHYEFRLVKEALAEREVLLKMAPHIASPMRFCLPHRPHLRPAWMIRAGLFLYDNLSSRVSLQGSKSQKFGQNSALKKDFKKGFEYSDAWVDDARLVVLNAMELKRRGGEVRTRTQAVHAERNNGVWDITLRDEVTGEESVVHSRALVNAAGPWVQSFFDKGLKKKSPRKIRLIKGSHIVVPRIHDEPRAYILQNEDNRIVFVIPYLNKYSLVGTTDVEYKGDPAEVSCSEEEKRYLCDVVNKHFRQQISLDDIVWDYSGVRPLCEDESDSPQAITRDYTMELEDEGGNAPLLSIFGGKLTTYRKLGEAAVGKLQPYFLKMGASWTKESQLPGSEQFKGVQACTEELCKAHPWLTQDIAARYSGSYGNLSYRLIGKSRSVEDFGVHFGAGLYAAEVDYLIENEWAYTVEDILWRRSKLGIELDTQEKERLGTYLTQRLPELLPERFGNNGIPLEKVV
ncbi:glycerol-3-phosphate dehydrogenase [Endozoicomonas arenosclerae]|uniref:glycerol-3-phosphate dehydrogenase n=1 Tax=Endozoicomonas arenosclerae TaxID=1633495 RepID=UPI000781427D|nr:glycerol-3-phosphate dehydrogenase [Endozoicomonas arenosclerae]